LNTSKTEITEGLRSKQEIFDFFESQQKEYYVKRGKFLCRTATSNETVLTIVSGKLETFKRATVGEAVLRNIEIGSSAETYIIAKEIFEKRYTVTEESHIVDGNTWHVAIAKGEVEAFQYQGGTICFIAPWDEEMICNAGDYIARPVPGDAKDIYRIEKATFDLTYSKK
jgi:hypothetical protein